MPIEHECISELVPGSLLPVVAVAMQQSTRQKSNCAFNLSAAHAGYNPHQLLGLDQACCPGQSVLDWSAASEQGSTARQLCHN